MNARRRLMRLAVLLALAASGGVAAHAQTPAEKPAEPPALKPSLASQDVPDVGALYLELVLNGRETGRIVPVRQLKGGDFTVPRADLTALRVAPPESAGADVAVVRSLGAKVKYDEQNQRLELTVPPESLAPQTIDAAAQREKAPLQTGSGFVVNYALNATTPVTLDLSKIRLNGASASFDARYFSPSGVFATSGAVRAYNATSINATPFTRYDSNYTYSDLDNRRTYVAGDVITGSLPWARSYRLGGLQLKRDFALRPDLITRPLLGASGTAAVPSTIDVFVGGVRTYSTQVEAGPYSLSNIPVIAGLAGAKIVVRDATGRETETALPFFTGMTLLAKGEFDYSVEAGAPRERYGTDSFGYSAKPAATGSFRYGYTDSLTIEGHGEAQESLLNLGGGVTTTLFEKFQVSGSGSLSRYKDDTGAQLYASISAAFGDWRIEASPSLTFGKYRDLAYSMALNAFKTNSLPVDLRYLEPARRLNRLSISAPLPQIEGAQWQLALLDSQRPGSVQRLVSSGLTRNLPSSSATIGAYAFADFGTTRNRGMFLTFSMNLGERLSTTTSLQHDGRALRPYASFVRQDDGTVGSWSYGASASMDANKPSGRANAQYRSAFGLARADVSRTRSSGFANVSFEGAAAYIDGGVHFANRIDDSFAVVDARKPNVPILLENRPVGRTNENGKLLIPNLRSQVDNRLTVDVDALPLDVTVGETEKFVKPMRKHGVTVEFGEAVNRSALVALVPAKGEIPVGATARLTGAEAEFIVGFDGEVWIESGLQDQNELTVVWPGGACKAHFAYAPTPGEMTRIDKTPCK